MCHLSIFTSTFDTLIKNETLDSVYDKIVIFINYCRSFIRIDNLTFLKNKKRFMAIACLFKPLRTIQIDLSSFIKYPYFEISIEFGILQ